MVRECNRDINGVEKMNLGKQLQFNNKKYFNVFWSRCGNCNIDIFGKIEKIKCDSCKQKIDNLYYIDEKGMCWKK